MPKSRNDKEHEVIITTEFIAVKDETAKMESINRAAWDVFVRAYDAQNE